MGEPEITETTGVGETTSVGDEPSLVPMRARDPLFVGRRSELATLDAALFASRQACTTVIVEGESGIGKSALVARFVESAHSREPRLFVLHGRCHDAERVPFNAFAGVIDDLRRRLLAQRPDKLEKMVPPGTKSLLALFPALRTVEALATAAKLERPVANIRSDAFSALRELFVRLCRRRPTVIVIEDLQWADPDSWALLAELVRPEGETPRICLVATRRTRDGDAPVDRLGKLRTLVLRGLEASEAEDLVQQVAVTSGVRAAQIVAETRGHPMFVRELARQPALMRLPDAIWARASRLDSAAQQLLAAVAAASSPIPRHVAIAAAELALPYADSTIATLTREALVRVNGPTPQCAIEAFHDRIGEAVLAHQPDPHRRALEASLARGLEAAGAPAATLLAHFQAAGDDERAAHYLAATAEAARAAFAFGTAAELYRRALEAQDLPRERRAWLLEQLAESLVSDGRTAEAAERWVEAAELEEPGSDRQVDLLRRAAERFLMSGRLAQGLETTRAALERANMTLPSSRTRTIAGIAWNQLVMRGRRLHWAEPRNGARSLDADVCWTIGAGLGMVDSLLGAYFVGRAARLALARGNSLQICRAMAAATIGAAVLGHEERARRLHACAERAATEDGTPLAQWYVGIARAGMSFMVRNDWVRAFQDASALEEEWYAAGHGPSWETDVAMHFSLFACQMLGNMDELGRRVATRVQDAKRMGDVFQELTLRMRFGVRHLADDRPDEARQDVLDALAAWLPGTDSFGNQRAWALWSRTRTALYTGTADDELDAEWERMRRSLVGRVPLLQIESLQVHGAYLLGRAQRARHRGLASEHAELCARVERLAARAGKLDFPAAPVAQHILRAGVAWAQGNQDEILRLTRFALDQTIERGVLVYAAFLKRRLGEAMGGDEGATLISQADALAVRSGWVKPERGAELAFPITPLG